MRPSAIRCLSFSFFLATVLAAQRPLEFEVASVRPSGDQGQQTATVGIRISGSQLRIVYESLRDYIARAYRVRATQVEGPDWIAQERFDILAKLPDGSTIDQVPEMLQSLLSTRFELQTHRISREFPVYALIAAKSGPMLPQANDQGASAPSGTINVTGTGSASAVAVDLGGGSSFWLADGRLVLKNVTMTQAADALTRLASRPVVDTTGIAGAFDLSLDLTAEDFNATIIRAAVNQGVALPSPAFRVLDGAALDPFTPSLQKYGLLLESRRAPLDVIVVDSMRRAPTSN